MISSKHLFPLGFFLIFLFPLLHASNPKKCSSSFYRPHRCGPLEVPIRFPFCDHPGFNLHCTDLDKTVLELPMSGTFLVRDIDYYKQLIYISDPENCLAKRLLTFDLSGSPFSPRFSIFYTFFSCPNDVVLPSSYRSIPCLNNSTSSVFATSDYVSVYMFPSCQIVKKLYVPHSSPFGDIDLSSYVDNQSIMLEWFSPNCRSCEMNYLRCGFKKSSVEITCLGAKKPGHLSSAVRAVIIIFSIMGAVTLFGACIAIRIHNSRRFSSRRQGNTAIAATTVRQQPREITAAPRGLDQSTIETYKKVELGESRRPPGNNGIVCPICLSEYVSKETIRFMPECDHCFHVDCIDVWLKIHGSCPLCRNSRK